MQTSYLLLAAVVPFIILDFWYTGIVVLWILKIAVILYLIIFGLLPLVFHYSYSIQRKILFLNFVSWPPNVDLANPSSVGLEGARNFYLHTDQNVKIGVWQILPASVLNKNMPLTVDAYENALNNATNPIVLYMHGNSGNRASSHRVELYKLFQNLDYNILCFDYRSYGDSEMADLSEEGVVADSKYIVEWLIKKVNSTAPIFVWGHSLGTGVSTHVLALLASEGIQPTGLILESPFNNIADELSEHPLAQIFKHLPWFYWVIVEPFYQNNLRFESDKHIVKVKCPVLILHAEDDNVIPIFLAEKLYKAALNQYRDERNFINMVTINSSYGLGHKYICRYNSLPAIIKLFVNEAYKTQNN
ncbi:lysophosphatidylserine lipase ABHD12 isoform X2 [Prorops nasuta]|uniref:lysophosphatidylserine lipase ABHD12 isoform X2 n=1 Tax=Prorops nasuta TaxID=863751 RepID=UPI0034CD71BC